MGDGSGTGSRKVGATTGRARAVNLHNGLISAFHLFHASNLPPSQNFFHIFTLENVLTISKLVSSIRNRRGIPAFTARPTGATSPWVNNFEAFVTLPLNGSFQEYRVLDPILNASVQTFFEYDSDIFADH